MRLSSINSTFKWRSITVKDRAGSVQRKLRLESQASAWAWNAYDSTGRYWSLQTDSPFYYHPDRGLFVYGGQLVLVEAQVQRQAGLQKDSGRHYELNEQSAYSYMAEPVAGYKLSY